MEGPASPWELRNRQYDLSLKVHDDENEDDDGSGDDDDDDDVRTYLSGPG